MSGAHEAHHGSGITQEPETYAAYPERTAFPA
jgi:hypothetical protein